MPTASEIALKYARVSLAEARLGGRHITAVAPRSSAWRLYSADSVSSLSIRIVNTVKGSSLQAGQRP